MRAELLSQSRKASLAVEGENEELRMRAMSLTNDIIALQGVLEEHRAGAEVAAQALRV